MLGSDWRFCPHCAARLERTMHGGQERPRCGRCGFLFFANMGVGAAVAIRDDAGQLLLVQRGPRQFGAGRWCFPCGFVEWGEDVADAARREALEEAGVEVELGEVVQVATNIHEPSRPTVGIWYAARLVDPYAVPIPGDDAVGVQWIDPANPPPLAFPTDRALLERLAQMR